MIESLVFFAADQHPTSLQPGDIFVFEDIPNQGTTLCFKRSAAGLLIRMASEGGNEIVSGFSFKKRLDRPMKLLIARLIAAASGHSIIQAASKPLSFTLA